MDALFLATFILLCVVLLASIIHLLGRFISFPSVLMNGTEVVRFITISILLLLHILYRIYG